MDQYKRITKANIGTTASTWGYDANNNLSSISAPGVHVDSYTYDPLTGNLTYRKNWYQNKEENFGYDLEQLDKLTSVTGPVGQNISYTTDKTGNILSKSDAGSYVYLPARPYAVDQINNGQNIPTSQQTNRFTAFGKVKQLTEGIRTAEFDYNMDQQRVRMVMREYGNVFKTRYYFGGSCEREEVGSTTTQYIFIGGDAYTAVAVAKKVGTGNWTIYNIFRDHLGTITHLKDATTGIVTEYSFDAWGRRRDANDWTTTLTNEPALFADRGFTGHEYLEDFKLYNMNGRLYDPVVGRFLSPDPFIQDPANTQSYNRYSYCLNNPLKYTDPSGNTWWDKFWDWTAKYGIQFGVNMGPRGFTPNVSAPGPGNTRMSVGYNIQSGRIGFGNNSSGFMEFYFPQMNLNYPKQISEKAVIRARDSKKYKNIPGGNWDFWGNGGEVKYQGKAIGGTNFIGPGPDENPYKLELDPVDEIDAAAQSHDYAYWQAGTGGFRGAKYNTAVRFADAELVYSSVSIMERYPIGGIDKITGQRISERTFNLATAIYLFFSPIVVEKFRREGVIYPQIYPNYPKY